MHCAETKSFWRPLFYRSASHAATNPGFEAQRTAAALMFRTNWPSKKSRHNIRCKMCQTRYKGSFVLTNSRPPPSDFIGRHQEMAELEEVLDDALSGRGRIVMLAGEPGIGKTRLAQELAFPCGIEGRSGAMGLVLRT